MQIVSVNLVPKTIETGNQSSSFQNIQTPQSNEEHLARQYLSGGKVPQKPADKIAFYTVSSPKLLSLNKLEKTPAGSPTPGFGQLDLPKSLQKPLNRSPNESNDTRFSHQPTKSDKLGQFGTGVYNQAAPIGKNPFAPPAEGNSHFEKDPVSNAKNGYFDWDMHLNQEAGSGQTDFSNQVKAYPILQTPQQFKKTGSFKMLPPPPPQYQEESVKKRLPPPPVWPLPEHTLQSPKMGLQVTEGKLNKQVFFAPQLSLKKTLKLDIHPDSCYNFLNKRRYNADPQSHTPLEDFFLKESVGQYKIARTVALHSQPPLSTNPIFMNRHKNHLLVLDIDETLVHSDLIVEQSVELEHMKGKKYDTKVNFPNPNKTVDVYGVRFRPFLLEFIDRMHRIFDLAVYTASTRDYADAVVNALDPAGDKFVARLYRENCIPVNGMNIKNMGHFAGHNAIIVDNLIYSYAFHMGQGIPICPFIDDDMDVELKDLAELLENLSLFPDLFALVDELLGLNEFYAHLEQQSAKSGGYEALSPAIHHAPVSTNERTAHGSLMTSLL